MSDERDRGRSRRLPRGMILALCFWTLATPAAFAQVGKSGDNGEGGADAPGNGANSANDPASPKLTFEYWNYFSPSVYGSDHSAENGLGRILVPFKLDGVQQFLHIVPNVTGAPTAPTGPRTGSGDLQIYNFTLRKFDVGLPEKVTFGLGPLIAPPTATNKNFGPDRLQAGVAGVVSAPQRWGLLGILATYQHTTSGPSSQYTTVQPNIYYNLKDSWYLRSSAIMKFDSASHTNYIPIGFGAGKVLQLEGGYTLNTYVEAQPTVYHTGTGAPAFQIFTGIELQFPVSTTAGLDFWGLVGQALGPGSAASRDAFQGYETAIEASYAIQVTRALQIQPDAQYIAHPGGGMTDPNRPGHDIESAAVFGVGAVATL